MIEIDSTEEVSYVRITATKASNGNWFAARMFNFYQDATKSAKPSAGIHYSTTEVTNGEVVATLIDYDQDNIEILGDGKNTHTFTTNGEFEFVIMDTFTNNKSSIIAKVDWIDKENPIGYITYSTTNKTNQSVTAALTVNEEVTILNNTEFKVNNDGKIVNSIGEVMDGYTIDNHQNIYDKNGNYITNIDSFKYEFMDNGEYTFKFVDKAGNKGTATAKVDWIDKEAPIASLEYDNTSKTSNDVTVKIHFNEENVTILNNDGNDLYKFHNNGEFTFEYVDEAGNHGSITARVNWIDKKITNGSNKVEESNKIEQSKNNSNNSVDSKNKTKTTDNVIESEEKTSNTVQENDTIQDHDSKGDNQLENDNKDSNEENTVIEERKQTKNGIHVIPYVVVVLGLSITVIILLKKKK